MDLKKLSVMELLKARDEAIQARDDIGFFFDARFCKCTHINDSNPMGLPTLVGVHESEEITLVKRRAGLTIQCLVEQYDSLIHDLTHEILERT